MSQLVINHNDKPIMTSREIAEMYDKPHNDVLKKIRKLESAYTQVFGNEGKFSLVEYQDGKGEMRPEIHLNKSQALFIASRFNAVLHAKVQKRWEEFETAAQDPVAQLVAAPKSEILLLAANQAVTIEQQDHQLKEQAPKVKALERLTLSEGSHNITNTAKQLDVQPKKLFTLLSEKRWIYRRVGGKNWVGYQDKIQQGLLTHKVTTREIDGIERMFEQVLVTPKGATKIAEKFLSN